MSEEAAKPAAAPGPSKLPMLLALLNVLGMLGALGAFVYTRVIYKRPPITEEAELAKFQKQMAAPGPPPVAAMVPFEPVTVNIASSPAAVGPGTKSVGRMHYATIGFSLEIRDEGGKQDIENLRSMIMDKFIGILGRRQFHELNNVQGRYVLRSQLLQVANEIVAANAGRIKGSPPPAAAAPAAEGGGEGGEGGEGHGEKKAEAARPPVRDVASYQDEDLITNVFFTQFVIQ